MRPTIDPVDGDAIGIVVRTDYSDDATWLTISALVEADEGIYVFVDDPAWDGANADDVLAAMSDNGGGVVFVADVTAMREPYPLLAVNTATRERCLDDEDYAHEMRHGREFRLLPAGVGDVIGNVSLANMDFPEFAAWAKTAPSGYFRGAGADRT